MPVDMEKIVSLAKRRGFIFQSSEIYGGLSSTWDYGPLGAELKRNVKNAWWRSMVHQRDDVVGLDAAILMHPKVWEASGHVAGFRDPVVECKACHQRFRPDKVTVWLIQGVGPIFFYGAVTDPELDRSQSNPSSVAQKEINEEIKRRGLKEGQWKVEPTTFQEWMSGSRTIVNEDIGSSRLRLSCPLCRTVGQFTEARMFNLMFKTFVGPVEDEAFVVYLRPETAQGILVNFRNVIDSMRRKLPLGIAQIGKAFRNEITPGNFTFRTREFEQMELEFFCKPGTDEQWHKYWLEERFQWYVKLGMHKEHLRLRVHGKDELAHYAKGCSDIEYLFPMGWSELEGIANRSDFDLKQHQQYSKKDLTYFDDETKERYTPYVIEPSGGVDRAALAFLIDAYHEEMAPTGEGNEEQRVVLKFHPAIAPIKVAVLPLSRNERLVPKAREVFASVRKHFICQYDDAQSIGRRYRRQDEAGTPLCVTVDFQSLEDNAVTIRARDSMKQERVGIPELAAALQDKLKDAVASAV